MLVDVNFDICSESKRTKFRKGDIYRDSIRGLWRKYSNATVSCPFKKGIYSIRGVTFNEVKIPLIQYFVGNDDFQVEYEVFTKVKRKLFTMQVIRFIGGIRKTID